MTIAPYTIASMDSRINNVLDGTSSGSWLAAFTPQFDSDQIDAAYRKLISTGNLAIQFNATNIAITDGTNTAIVAHGGFSAGDTVTGVFTANASTSELQVGLVGTSSITWGTATSYTGGFLPGTKILIAEDNEEYFQFNYWDMFEGVPGGDGEVLAVRDTIENQGRFVGLGVRRLRSPQLTAVATNERGWS